MIPVRSCKETPVCKIASGIHWHEHALLDHWATTSPGEKQGAAGLKGIPGCLTRAATDRILRQIPLSGLTGVGTVHVQTVVGKQGVCGP